MRRNVNPKVTGNSITRMKRTRKAEFLIEVSGGVEAMTAIKSEVERSLVPGAKIKKHEDMSFVELQDLDEETIKEEVFEAVAAWGGDENARVVGLRKSFGGSQKAVVLLPSPAARRLCAGGRLRVGLIYTRVRSTKLPTRCFKCHAFGNVARECVGTDRGACCWRCGVAGHFFCGCEASQNQAASNRAALANKSSVPRRSASVGQAALSNVDRRGENTDSQDW